MFDGCHRPLGLLVLHVCRSRVMGGASPLEVPPQKHVEQDSDGSRRRWVLVLGRAGWEGCVHVTLGEATGYFKVLEMKAADYNSTQVCWNLPYLNFFLHFSYK